MPRVTLYVPDDLKVRMDGLQDGPNWSAVAQRAFREAIATQDLRRTPTDMTATIERLRASKQKTQEAEAEFGKQCGAEWARTTAEYDELHRVWGAIAGGSEVDMASLQQLIDPERELDFNDWRAFWGDHAGDAPPTDAFAGGFAAGAHDVFEEVRDEL